MFRDDRLEKNILANDISYRSNLTHESYFKLYNLPVSNKMYADIWLYNSQIMSQSDHDILEVISRNSQLEEITTQDLIKYYE